MTKDHKIRVLCAGLSGQARERMKLKLMMHPRAINRRLIVRLNMIARVSNSK